jgi:hypothetical protein
MIAKALVGYSDLVTRQDKEMKRIASRRERIMVVSLPVRPEEPISCLDSCGVR